LATSGTRVKGGVNTIARCATRRFLPVPGTEAGNDDVIAKLGDIAAGAGLRRVSILAWRDLEDPEAGYFLGVQWHPE
jgi:hypothetical protein